MTDKAQSSIGTGIRKTRTLTVIVDTTRTAWVQKKNVVHISCLFLLALFMYCAVFGDLVLDFFCGNCSILMILDFDFSWQKQYLLMFASDFWWQGRLVTSANHTTWYTIWRCWTVTVPGVPKELKTFFKFFFKEVSHEMNCWEVIGARNARVLSLPCISRSLRAAGTKMQRLHVSTHVRRSGCKDLETTCSDAVLVLLFPGMLKMNVKNLMILWILVIEGHSFVTTCFFHPFLTYWLSAPLWPA